MAIQCQSVGKPNTFLFCFISCRVMLPCKCSLRVKSHPLRFYNILIDQEKNPYPIQNVIMPAPWVNLEWITAKKKRLFKIWVNLIHSGGFPTASDRWKNHGENPNRESWSRLRVSGGKRETADFVFNFFLKHEHNGRFNSCYDLLICRHCLKPQQRIVLKLWSPIKKAAAAVDVWNKVIWDGVCGPHRMRGETLIWSYGRE